MRPLPSNATIWPTKQHPLADIKKVLDLASHYISAETTNIFIQTADEAALNFLKEAVLSFEDDKQDGHSLKESFDAHLRQRLIQLNPAAKPPEAASRHLHANTLSEVTTNTSFDEFLHDHTDSYIYDQNTEAQNETTNKSIEKEDKGKQEKEEYSSANTDSQLDEKTPNASSDVHNNQSIGFRLDLSKLNISENEEVKKSAVHSVLPKFPNEIEWAVLVKLMFAHGEVLDEDRFKVTASWGVLIAQLNQFYGAYKDKLKTSQGKEMEPFKHDIVNRILENFIGQLVKIDETESALVIHNFLYLIMYSYQKSNINELDPKKVGLTLGATLGNALNLLGNLATHHKAQSFAGEPSSSSDIIRETHRDELEFLKFLFKSTIYSDMFKSPFNADKYSSRKQDLFEEMLCAVKSAGKKALNEIKIPPRNSFFSSQTSLSESTGSNSDKIKRRSSSGQVRQLFLRQFSPRDKSCATSPKSPRADIDYDNACDTSPSPTLGVSQRRSSNNKGNESPRETLSKIIPKKKKNHPI